MGDHRQSSHDLYRAAGQSRDLRAREGVNPKRGLSPDYDPLAGAGRAKRVPRIELCRARTRSAIVAVDAAASDRIAAAV